LLNPRRITTCSLNPGVILCKFEILTVVTVKITAVLRNVRPWRPAFFISLSVLLVSSIGLHFSPEDESSGFLQNVGDDLAD
jgi:hypothetical protein